MKARSRSAVYAVPALVPSYSPWREREAPRIRFVRRTRWAEQIPKTLLQRPLRDVPGVIFLAFGLMKAFASTFPLLNAWMVILVEVLCGVGLIHVTQ